jgi:WhiB family redox-sensing transcriptional regulator
MFASDVFDGPPEASAAAVDWSAARCRDGTGSLTELFFSDEIPDIRRAKTICLDCSLVAACLAGALERREPWGVWGGELFANGKVLAQKRRRGRPPKNRPVEGIQLTA